MEERGVEGDDVGMRRVLEQLNLVGQLLLSVGAALRISRNNLDGNKPMALITAAPHDAVAATPKERIERGRRLAISQFARAARWRGGLGQRGIINCGFRGSRHARAVGSATLARAW